MVRVSGVGIVTSAQIADGAVTTSKLADGAVTNAKIATDNIRLDKIDESGMVSGNFSLAAGAYYLPAKGWWTFSEPSNYMKYSIYSPEVGAWQDRYDRGGEAAFFDGANQRVKNDATSAQTIYYWRIP
jgi:hypothetical protein